MVGGDCTEELYAVEYSVSQKYYNIDTLNRCIENNIISSIQRNHTDYLIIGICKNHEDADWFIKTFQSKHHLPANSL